MKKYMLSMAMVLLYACQKDTNVQPKTSNTGRLQFVFETYVDNVPLELYTKKYLSPALDTFQVQRFKFFTKVEELHGPNGDFPFKLNYHLISYTSESVENSFLIDSIAVGEYNHLHFNIGVDSVNNHSTAYLGELVPGSGMTWGWSTGYKFLLFEGEFFSSTKDTIPLVFHIGEDKNFKTLHFDLPSILKVESGKTTTIKLRVNINELFKTPNAIDFDQVNEAMFGTEASKISDNYANGMFSISQVLNP